MHMKQSLEQRSSVSTPSRLSHNAAPVLGMQTKTESVNLTLRVITSAKSVLNFSFVNTSASLLDALCLITETLNDR